VQKKGKSHVDRFDTSVFSGEYVTGDVNAAYLGNLEDQRSDDAKQQREAGLVHNVIGVHNDS
jgi:amidophosphoribosyltransferase